MWSFAAFLGARPIRLPSGSTSSGPTATITRWWAHGSTRCSPRSARSSTRSAAHSRWPTERCWSRLGVASRAYRLGPFGQPRVSLGVLARVIGVEVDEAALNLPVADLEHVAPAPRLPLGQAGPPRPVAVLAVTGPFAHDHVAAREDPVELRIVVTDRDDGAADVGET